MTRTDDAALVLGGTFLLAHRWQSLGDRIDDRITTKQWFVIAAIARSPRPDPNLTDVASFVGISRQAVRKIVDILVRKNLLSIGKDPDDARVIRLRLTPECTTHLAQRDPAERRVLDDLFADLDDAELRGLATVLGRLIDTTDALVGGNESEDS